MRDQNRDLFRGLREHSSHEPLDNIDYKKSAKMGKWIVREYESHKDHHLIIILDLGRTYSGQVEDVEKLHYYIASTMNLAKNALESGDKVSLLGLDHKKRFIIKQARSFNDFYSMIFNQKLVSLSRNETNYALLPGILKEISSKRSIVILFTDTTRASIQKQILRYCKPVFFNHLFSIISLIDKNWNLEDQIDTIDASKLDYDEYIKLIYCYELAEKSKVFTHQCRSLGGLHLLISTDYWMSSVSRTYQELRNSLQI